MRVPRFWLHDYCDPGIGLAELEHRLTMTGTKVEALHTHGVTALEHFFVGRVLTAERHPDADRLTVCTVDVGMGDERTIVCGAPNVAAGQIVAVAEPGAVMPDGTRLKRAKLRGVESAGMILAEDEVAIGPDHDGIMVLDPELQPGTPLADVLPIASDVLELEITPNRPDCLSIYGVAREVHAATGAPLTPPPWTDDPGGPGAVPGVTVEVQDAELCPRFTARLYEDVKIGPSPEWLKARLTAAGMRPINNVVDITNFVMLATGQPMHAFDHDLVGGGRLVVRRALDGETMTTLDDVERTLDADMVIICDDDGPTSIAGIMGGERSEVRETTTRVLMEAANWNGPNIQRSSTRLGLRSEASGRFEKQLQPEQAMDGQALAAILMTELAGARIAGGTIDVGGPGPDPVTLRLRDERVTRLLGTEIPRADGAEILRRLEFGVADADDGLDVTVPAFRRGDVTREVDLVEEVARLWGLEKLPATLPSRRGATGVLSPEQRLRRRAEDALAGAGLSEVAGWVFAAPDLVDRLRIPAADPRHGAVVLRNPMSEDMSVMRTTLLGSLLDVARRNRSRGMPDVRLFELGAVFLDQQRSGTPTAAEQRSEPLPEELQHVAALLAGPVRPPSWRESEPPQADFFAVKAVLAALLDFLRVPWSVERAREPFLHPGRSAAVLIDGTPAGWLGEIHPAVARAWDLDGAAGFEVDFDRLAAAAEHTPAYQDLTSFPAVLQDRAWWFAPDVPAADVVATVREAGGPLLRAAEIFDVYPAEGRVSLALRLRFRADDRTLTDEEVAQRREKIDAAVAERLGGEPRG
ncbi:MAG TPA: phenylalanine--tRNA ligase subunit beta [Solirubrobacteraceae bacterium]